MNPLPILLQHKIVVNNDNICLEQVDQEYDRVNDLLEVTSADFRADFERWQVTKQQDVKQLLTHMAVTNISCLDDVINYSSLSLVIC